MPQFVKPRFKGSKLPKFSLGAFLGKGLKAGTGANAIGQGAGLISNIFGDGVGGSTASGLLKGVGAGATFGPIGMIGGGIIGGLTGLFGAKKRQKEEDEMRRRLEEEARRQREELAKMNSKAVLSTFPTQGVEFSGFYALGGVPSPTNASFEVEKGEVMQGNNIKLEQGNKIASDIINVGGDLHSQGGTVGEGGERIYSDRLRIPSHFMDRLKTV